MQKTNKFNKLFGIDYKVNLKVNRGGSTGPPTMLTNYQQLLLVQKFGFKCDGAGKTLP